MSDLDFRSPETNPLDLNFGGLIGIKVWDGVDWVLKPLKVWDGAEWVSKPIKVWDGVEWA